MSETQTVETISNPVVENRISSRNSSESMKEVTVSAPPEIKAPEEITSTSEPASTPAFAENENEGELPEYAKRRLGKERKKYERQLAQVTAELDAERARNAAPPPIPQYGAQSPNGYLDPLITGKYIDPNTEKGQAILEYQQELSQHLAEQDKQQQERQAKEVENKLHEHFESSFDDAAEKHADFEKVIKGAGINLTLGRELAYFQDPGELGYYIASNPREVERLQKLPAYEMRRELTRHMAEMVSKNNVTRTPPPVKVTGSNSGSPTKASPHKSIAELREARRAQLSGTSSRRR